MAAVDLNADLGESFGVWKLGATVAPLDALLKPAEQADILADLDPVLLVRREDVETGTVARAQRGGARGDAALILYTSGSTGRPKGAMLSHPALTLAIESWAGPVMSLTPEEYFKRQCWISFDPGERTPGPLAPLVGADRYIWASDFPHNDAKYPGVVDELREHNDHLADPERKALYGLNACTLYGIAA